MPSTAELTKFVKKGGFLIIDSNIFFKVDYHIWLNDLFNKISFFKGKIPIFDKQIDEIKNLTLSEDNNESYKARNAIRFIEMQLDRELVDIVNSYKPKKYHVDKLILEEIEKSKNKNIMLITDDKELRINSKKFNNKSHVSTYTGNGIFIGFSSADFLMVLKSSVTDGVKQFLHEIYEKKTTKK
ncbi:PIN domain-containing protein [Gluconobacter oxydans]|uniref:hypothetical protein n=1 Tax=Gluconobacter oxydans TaxID=442 RepID=UPI000A550A78|nr:hypothetical protein [Gluconobacter oxydans]